MKAKQLIQDLQKAVNEHDNLNILVRWSDEGDNFSALTISPAPSNEETIDLIVSDAEETTTKASELIHNLQMSVETYGDLEVCVRWIDGGIDFSGLSVSPDPASAEEKKEGIEGTIDLVIWAD